MHRADIVDNANIQAGDLIVGLASYGQAQYEREYNGAYRGWVNRNMDEWMKMDGLRIQQNQ